MAEAARTLGQRILSQPDIAKSVLNILEIAEAQDHELNADDVESSLRSELTLLGKNTLQSWACPHEQVCTTNANQTLIAAKRHGKKNFCGIPFMAIFV